MTNFFKTLVNKFYQTKDNNVSFENQLENEILTDNLKTANAHRTLELLKDYEIRQELKQSGLLLTNKEVNAKAAVYYLKLLNAKLIDEWGCLVPGVLEEIKQESDL